MKKYIVFYGPYIKYLYMYGVWFRDFFFLRDGEFKTFFSFFVTEIAINDRVTNERIYLRPSCFLTKENK
jgi:hypothetical protein